MAGTEHGRETVLTTERLEGFRIGRAGGPQA